MKTAKLIKRFRVEGTRNFRLADFDSAETCGLDIGKDAAKAIIAEDLQRLTRLQERLAAQHRWAVLIVLQGMDTSGKDGVIKHVMSGLNPQGCQVHSFKAPAGEEIEHDFLWRAARNLPPQGRIGIFNRSYYEDVLVVRVRPELLAPNQRSNSGKLWEHRFESIRGFERHLVRNETVVLKFHLRISQEEQRQRLLARLDEPDKHWKFSSGDLENHWLWDKYMAAYEDAIGNTATAKAPWYVVPADHKWFAWIVVAAVIADALEGLDLQYPKLDDKKDAELRKARKALSDKKT
jgi:PPK2 family polyphosphate:nucleotide phosphotransferase